MKKLWLMLMMGATLGLTAQAQEEQRDMGKTQQEQTEWDNRVKTELNLNAEQAQQYEALSREYHEKINTLKQDGSLSKEQMKQRKEELKKEKEDRLSAFLTPEQMTRYREMSEQKKKNKDKSSSQY